MLSRFFLDRPVFAWVIAIIMMLAGGLAIYTLPVSQYPPIAPPSIAIDAFYPGASAETVENSVVQIIEQKMTGFDKLLYMSATSDASGAGRIELTFAPGTDPDLAWAQVQNKLQLAMASLPEVVQTQGVKVSKSTRNWLIIVGLVSEDGSMDDYDLGDYAQSIIQQVLARVPGVGEVEVFSSQYSMRVWLNPDRLADYRMTVEDVVRRLKAYNVEISAGQFGGAPAVEGQRLNASIIVQNLLKTPEEFAAIPLRTNPDGSIVRVRDVGRTELGTERYGSRTLTNGKPSAALAVRQAPGANALATADAIKAKMEELSKYFPPGMKAIYPNDTTPFVKEAIKEVVKTLFEAVLLVFLVMYLFLGNIRATLIPTLAVPVVILGTFAVLGLIRVLHQHADHVRNGARDRPAGGRRHRRGRERRAGHVRGGALPPGGHAQVHGRDHERLDRHRARALGSLRADGVLQRFHRRHLPAVLRDGHRRHAPVRRGRPDPDPGPVRLAAQAGGEGARGRRGRLRPVPPLLPLVRPGVPARPEAVRECLRARHREEASLSGHLRPARGGPGLPLPAHAHGVPPPTRIRASCSCR